MPIVVNLANAAAFIRRGVEQHPLGGGPLRWIGPQRLVPGYETTGTCGMLPPGPPGNPGEIRCL
jgi:hypothetical protein